MALLETLKQRTERVTGLGRPKVTDIGAFVRSRKANRYRFGDDGEIPNNPELPLIHYRSPVELRKATDPATLFEVLFESYGWRGTWRDGIYDFVHYHSRTHEVLGIARGEARVQFGGTRGRQLTVKAGDVVILPAGTGHQRISASSDFLVVGAYPLPEKYDVCRISDEERERALVTIPKVPVPKKDPVYGSGSGLEHVWRTQPAAGRHRHNPG